MKYAWISEHCDSYPVAVMCEVLCVSTSGYYGWLDRVPSPRAERHERIQQAVRQVHAESHGIYGSHKIAEVLDHRNDLESACRNTVAATMKKAAEAYALGPTRVQHQNKDPRGWREFADQLAEHSTEGAALTMRGVQKRRPSLFDLVDKMKTMSVPTLIMTGDEDWPCLEPGILMKKNIPTAALVVMANSGHNINLEEPALFNMHLSDLFQAADAGAWPRRDPRAMASSILGR